MGVKVAVLVREAVHVGRGVRDIVGVRLGICVLVNVAEGVSVPSGLGVIVSVGFSVAVAEGAGVALGSGVTIGKSTGMSVRGKIWLATGFPNKAEATVDDSKTSASSSHCQPASVYALRVR